MAKRICISLCHHNRLFREGIKQILQHANYRVLASSSSFDEACNFDFQGGELVFLIGESPSLAAELSQVPDLKERYPGCRVVILFDNLTVERCLEAQDCGVDAALPHSISSDVLLLCLKLVQDGDLQVMLVVSQLARAEGKSPDELKSDVVGSTILSARAAEPAVVAAAQAAISAVPVAIDGTGEPAVDRFEVVYVEPARPVEADPAEPDLDASVDGAPPLIAPPASFVGYGGPHAPDENLDRRWRLSDREQDILRCLIDGYSNKVIARCCGITEATVKVHLKAVLRKIHVSNRTQAAVWAITNIKSIAGG